MINYINDVSELNQLIGNLDLYDFYQEFKENQVMIINNPQNINIDDYIKNLNQYVFSKQPKYIILFDTNLIKYIQQDIIITDRVILEQYINKKYYLQPRFLIGITGSSGKSSTVLYLIELFKKLNLKIFVSASIGIGITENLLTNSLTTPNWCTLKRNLHKFHYCDIGIIECSSAGIIQGRLKYIKFDVAIYTSYLLNHLETHKTEQEYIHAKQLLFDQHLKDDSYVIAKQNVPLVHHNKFEYTSLTLVENTYYKNLLQSVDFFHRENLTAALLCYQYYIFKHNLIEKELNFTISIPNRMELLGYNKYKCPVYIDGAHAYQQVINIITMIQNKNNYIVYGISAKRFPHDLGTYDSSKCHWIFCYDTPMDIGNKILGSMLNNTIEDNYTVVPDRFKAIKYALENCQQGTIVVLGKSTEVNTSITYNNNTIYYNEASLIKEYLKDN